MSCPSTGPVDPRVRRTRKLLHDALRSLLNERPFSAITVQDIAERATVNRATFYSHYLDKYDLVASNIRTDLQAMLMKRFAVHPDFTAESLVVFAEAVFRFLADIHDSCPRTARELQDTIGSVVQEDLYEGMMGWLSATTKFEDVFAGRSKEGVATVLVWSIYGGAHRWVRSSPRPPVEEVCQEIVSMLVPRPAVSREPLLQPV